MAFCAQCGKANVDGAAICDGCGKPMPAAAPKPAGAPGRFKGTMIMGGAALQPTTSSVPAAVAPSPVAAAASSSVASAVDGSAVPGQPSLAFQATMLGGPIALSAPPPPAGSAPPPAGAAASGEVPSVPARVSPKGTMIGGLGLAGALQPSPAAAASASEPVVAAADGAGLSAPLQNSSAPAASDGYVAAPALRGSDGGAPSYGGYGAPMSTSQNRWVWLGVAVVAAVGTLIAIASKLGMF